MKRAGVETKRDFISIGDWTGEELRRMIDLSAKMKDNPANFLSSLKGKSLAMILEKPSLRTRVSFQVAMRALGASFSTLAASVLTAIHGNVGNFGLAICAFAFGADVLPIAGIVMVTVNTVGILVGVGMATIRHGSLARAAVTAVISPLALAVVPALLVNVSNAELPVWLDRPISLLAGALIPVMLLTLGIQLAGMSRTTLPSRLVAVPIVLKLLLAPLIAWVTVILLRLTGDAGSVVILQAAMPAAVFTSLIALEHDLEADFVTSAVLVGTLLSALTLPVVIPLL